MERDQTLESEGAYTERIILEQPCQLVALHRVGQRASGIFQVSLARADKQPMEAVRRVGIYNSVMGG